MKKELTPKQKLFCQLFASDREFFGNGTQAYLEAFSTKEKPITYSSARVLAHQLLTKVNITDSIRKLMNIFISNEVVDTELAAVILQWSDIPSKVAAIREYNKVNSRITDQVKHIVEVKVDSKQLNQFIIWRKKQLKK